MKQSENTIVNEFVKGIFKPGSVLVSYGMRGGGKTHCAISFCQRLIEGYYPDMPKHIVLVTNVIFVKKTQKGFSTESPKGVYTIHEMKDLFPVVLETLEKNGRKDTMIILLLDEAQNFLLGDMNNTGDMAASMKVFCGIIRKFNLCLWLLSPAMRNLGPAFRNFLDADTDPGNVNCTFQKNNAEATRYLKSKKLDRDPRSIVFVKPGFNERTELMTVPTSSWTRDPETMAVGEYAYDNLSSADFSVGDFPFHEFVRHISGKSSYEMVSSIREFYAMLEKNPEDKVKSMDVQKVRMAYAKELTPLLREHVHRDDLAEIFGVSGTTISNWDTRKSKGKTE